LYKLVLKDALDASEVHPYFECDFSPIAAPADSLSMDEPDERELATLRDLAPLVSLIAAEQRAESILTEVRREAETIKRKAEEEGRSLGAEEGKKQVFPALTSLAQAVQSLIVFEERMITRFTPEIVRLALEIAEKIIGRAVEADAGIVASVLERAKKEITEARLIRVRLNPSDHCILAELRPELVRTQEKDGRKIEVAPSDDIARGGCRIETEIGVVDATIPTQLEEIQRQLLEE
jgi:flagellar biosynthesis/type III secretory pathway protein FliH